MAKRSFFLRYSVILKRLQKAPATLKEIVSSIEKEFDLLDLPLNYSKRTFQRDIQEIQEIFQVEIQFDFKRKVYFIQHIAYPKVAERMLETFDMVNAVNLSNDLTNSIHFESRKALGTEHFHGLLHAIKNTLIVKFQYHKYEEESVSQREVEPLVLKEFKNRWYLVAVDLKDQLIKTFGLDRIDDIEISRKRFTPRADVDLKSLYQDSFGIIHGRPIDLEEIILSFNPLQGKYIKSFSLHHSQRVLVDNEEKLDVSLNLVVTYDFIMELMSYGDNVKVITPSTLKDQICSTAQRMLTLYQN
jgi:predicted DNA-binding transcriptional regulator YafY